MLLQEGLSYRAFGIVSFFIYRFGISNDVL